MKKIKQVGATCIVPSDTQRGQSFFSRKREIERVRFSLSRNAILSRVLASHAAPSVVLAIGEISRQHVERVRKRIEFILDLREELFTGCDAYLRAIYSILDIRLVRISINTICSFIFFIFTVNSAHLYNSGQLNVRVFYNRIWNSVS